MAAHSLHRIACARAHRARARRWPTARRTGGFSLLELIVAIGIAGILVGLAAPPMTDVVREYRAGATRDEFAAAIELARVEAQRRAVPVLLQRRTGCGLTLTGPGDWSCGYRMFADSDRDDTLDSDEPVIREFVLDPGTNLTNAQGDAEQLRFNLWGQAGGGAQRFVVRVGGAAGRTGTVCLNAGGRLRVHKGEVTCS